MCPMWSTSYKVLYMDFVRYLGILYALRGLSCWKIKIGYCITRIHQLMQHSSFAVISHNIGQSSHHIVPPIILSRLGPSRPFIVSKTEFEKTRYQTINEINENLIQFHSTAKNIFQETLKN